MRDEELCGILRGPDAKHFASRAADRIAALEKRIAELGCERREEELREDERLGKMIARTEAAEKANEDINEKYNNLLSTWAESRERHLAAEQALTNERQRREECEEALRSMQIYDRRQHTSARAYFASYEGKP